MLKTIFQGSAAADLFIDVLPLRTERKYMLCEYVPMPAQFHALITTTKHLWGGPCNARWDSHLPVLPRFFLSLLACDSIVFPLVAAGIAAPLVFLGRVIRCNNQRGGPALKHDLLGIAFGAADHEIAGWFFRLAR